ncbi:MAG: hypothetical protein OEU36_19585 [Gammaproteobacteria bacterium]|nr:hypothetical protein [Gammaproteobacteria bacterium]
MLFLMCKPKYHRVDCPINPWMEKAPPIDPANAMQQWRKLYEIVANLAPARLVDPQPGIPDMYFASDCGIALGNVFLESNFKEKIRHRERKYYAAWFRRQGYTVVSLPEDATFKGMGDLILWHDRQAVFCWGSALHPKPCRVLRRFYRTWVLSPNWR